MDFRNSVRIPDGWEVSSDKQIVSRIWQDAAGILETATAQGESLQSDFAILVDDQNGMRIVDAAGWQLASLRAEYQAGTAYLVQRTPTSVIVQAESGADRCALQRTTGLNFLASLTGGVAHHLVRPEPLVLTARR